MAGRGRLGRLGMVGCGLVRLGKSGRGKAGVVRRGEFWRGVAWPVFGRRGEARLVLARTDVAGKAWWGVVRLGKSGHGWAGLA